MAQTLSDYENWVLWNTQQSELVNFGGVPNWSTATNPQLPKAAVDAAINRAYGRLMQELADLELATHTVTITSVAQTTQYALPPSGEPAFIRVCRVYYAPAGMSFTQELPPGARLVSWPEFQRKCGGGYLRPFTYGTIPDYATITPDRANLAFFPGTANSGDTITVEYVPYPTTGTTVAPLSAGTDSTILPDSCADAIQYLATAYCWPKLGPRDGAQVQEYLALYNTELQRLRNELAMRSRGDTQRITDARDEFMLTNPLGLPLIQ